MTEKKTISILGEELNIRFSMAVEIAYEELIGEAFSIQGLDKQKNSVALCMAAILVNNPKTEITMERFMNDISSQEYATLVAAVIGSMTEWMNIPAVIPKDEKPKSEDEDDASEKPKNA